MSDDDFGDFNSKDPFKRWAAHQAAKGRDFRTEQPLNVRVYELVCVGCARKPTELDEYIKAGADEGVTPEEFVITEEGTYNPENGHFVCTTCYIRMGMPTAPEGWRAP